MTVWIDVIGIGEDGYDGLSGQARDALEEADIVIGGSRHHGLAPHLEAERVEWPSPFSEAIGSIKEMAGRRVALLVTGDPLWYSAGALLLRHMPAGEIRFHPQLSAFQLACARMRWSLADVETLTAHGRPVEQLLPYVYPGSRLIVLTAGSEAPGEIGRMLDRDGYGESQLTVLGSLGGKSESSRTETARHWAEGVRAEEVPSFHTLCIECMADNSTKVLPRGPGLPDNAFESDGNFTKRELRVLALAALAPRPRELLWDVGSGAGSISIEWMRAARDALAIGIEPKQSRRETAKRNAERLGAPRLQLVAGRAPDAFSELPDPDAVFIGGGLSCEAARLAVERVKPFGRVVAHAVTLESEGRLARMHQECGGELTRISVSRARPVGTLRGWDALMPVTQWRYVK